MYVDDLVYNIRQLDFGFDQKINTNGTASTQPLGGLFNIEVESPKNTHLYAWGASNLDMKYVKLVFSPVTLASKSRTIELYDTLCIAHHDYFHSEGKDPMVSVLRLSPAIIVQDGQTMVEKNWKVTDLSRQNVEPTAVPVSTEDEEEQEESQPVITEMYYESLDGVIWNNWLDHGEFILCVKSQNSVGKSFSSNLNFPNRIIEYQGNELVDNKLENIAIKSNEMKIKLKSKLKTKKQ